MKTLFLLFILVGSAAFAQESCTDLSGTWTGFCTENGVKQFAHKVTMTQKSCVNILEDISDMGINGALQKGTSTGIVTRSETFMAQWTKNNTVLEWNNTMAQLDSSRDLVGVRIGSGAYTVIEGRFIFDSKWKTFALKGEEPIEKDQIFHCELDKSPLGGEKK